MYKQVPKEIRLLERVIKDNYNTGNNHEIDPALRDEIVEFLKKKQFPLYTVEKSPNVVELKFSILPKDKVLSTGWISLQMINDFEDIKNSDEFKEHERNLWYGDDKGKINNGNLLKGMV